MNALTIAMGLLSINGERIVVGEEPNLFVRDSSVERPLKRAKLSNNYIFDRPFVMPVFTVCTVNPGRQYNFGVNFYRDLRQQDLQHQHQQQQQEAPQAIDEEEEEEQEEEEEEQEEEEEEEQEEALIPLNLINVFEDEDEEEYNDEVGYDEADPEEDDDDAELIELIHQLLLINVDENDLSEPMDIDEPVLNPSHKRNLNDEEDDDDEQPDHKRCRIA